MNTKTVLMRNPSFKAGAKSGRAENSPVGLRFACLLLTTYILCCCTPASRFTNSANTTARTKKLEAQTTTPARQTGATFRGLASYYHDKFDGRTTASGEVFNQRLLTAAHKTLPFGTMVRVTNLKNNRQTVVKINDRGPFVEGRIIDLSLAAAKELDMVASGVTQVTIEILN